MANPEELLRLAEKVEGAKGADRDQFEQVYRALWPADGLAWYRAGWAHVEAGAYLDAVSALIQEKLPGWRISHLGETREHDDRGAYTGGWGARLHCTSRSVLTNLEYGQAATAPQALLSAFLRALATQEKESGHVG